MRRLLPQCAYLLCKPCQRRISRKRGSFFYWIVLRGKIEALARKIFVRRGRLSAVFVRLTLLRQITGRSVCFEGGVSPLAAIASAICIRSRIATKRNSNKYLFSAPLISAVFLLRKTVIARTRAAIFILPCINWRLR